MRAPFQILVIPFRKIENSDSIEYCIFNRSDNDYWQGIAGGGEGAELPKNAANREIQEETGLVKDKLLPLTACTMIPVVNIQGFLWGPDVLMIPEYCFGIKVELCEQIILSSEHSKYAWMRYSQADAKLKWESNKIALWELNHRLLNFSDAIARSL